MMRRMKLQGGVVVPTDQGGHGMVQLLTFYARDQLDLMYYSHPYDVDVNKDFDFLIVLSVEHFQDVIKFYDIKQADLPLIVHLDTPYALAQFNHQRAYPGVPVLSLPRATTAAHAPDVTLELNLVGKIEARLR